MGRAIVRQADAFLFDEPLSNLDAKLRGQMRTEIARLQKRLGITTVYVTHDQTEAMTLGDRVAVLKRGILQQLATPRELYEKPGQPVRRRVHRLAADELPAGDGRGHHREAAVRLRRDPGGEGPKAEGKGLLIAGIRPEHFEDASIMDAEQDGGPRRSARTVDVVEWLGNESLRLHPVRGAAGGAGAARPAREGPGRRVAAHPAGHLARRREPGRRGRRGRDLGQLRPDAPVRPLDRREPHRGHAARRGRCPEATRWPRPRRSRRCRTRARPRSRRRSRRPEPQRGSRLRRSSPGIARRWTVTPAISATPLTRTVG